MKKNQIVNIILLSCTTSTLMAAPNDLFLQAYQLSGNKDKLNVDVAVDAVNKTIDVFNVRDENNANDNAQNYIGGHIVGQYQLYPNWGVEAGFWQRNLKYSQDTNQIQSWLLATTYTPSFNLKENDALDFRLSLWGNYADQLQKTSSTRINGYTFNNIKVNDLSDIQVQMDSIFSRKLNDSNQLNAFASLGYSKVKVDSLTAKTKYKGCLVNIDIQSNNQYTGSLAQACTLNNLTITELNVSGSASDFNVDVQKDLNYDAYFANLGGSWNWRYQKFESQLAYQYQRLWRNDIDDRIANFGYSALKDNHTFSARLAYDLYPNTSVFMEANYFKRNFIGLIPFLYNGVTASRLDRKYAYLSLGMNFHF